MNTHCSHYVHDCVQGDPFFISERDMQFANDGKTVIYTKQVAKRRTDRDCLRPIDSTHCEWTLCTSHMAL